MDIEFTARRWTGDALAARLCHIIYGDDDVRADDDRRRWRIGIANDWWLHDLGDARWRLVYRYGTAEHMNGLAMTLSWLLHVTIERPE